MHHIKPPETLACLDLLRVVHGKHRRRGIGECLGKCLLNSLTSDLDTVFAREREVHLADRALDMEQRVGGVEENDPGSNWEV